jgi:hypothetical protein
MEEATEDMIVHAIKMVVVVVCSCYVWVGFLVCLEARATLYQYVIETCRGRNNNIIIKL